MKLDIRVSHSIDLSRSAKEFIMSVLSEKEDALKVAVETAVTLIKTLSEKVTQLQVQVGQAPTAEELAVIDQVTANLNAAVAPAPVPAPAS
jgi:hypothetical protein